MESVTPKRRQKATPWRPPSLSKQKENRCKAERRQLTCSHTPLAVPTKAQPCCSAKHRKELRLTKASHSQGQCRTIMTTLIWALISAGAGVLGNGPDLLRLHSGGLPTPLEPDLTQSCPHLGRRWVYQHPSQLPSVFTEAPHQTFIKGHLYSVWCEAISISQAVKWCLNQLLPGSVKKIPVHRFLSCLNPDRWGSRYVKILILPKYLKWSNDSKSQNLPLSVNDPSFFFFFLLPIHLN